MVAPEIGIGERSLLDEAMHIRDVLIEEQDSLLADLSEREAIRLADVRSRLGYSEVGSGYDIDLIDTRNTKESVLTPNTVASVLPVSESSARTTRLARSAIGSILTSDDDRLLVVTGPCSIHDPEEALEYADQVSEWRAEHGDDLEIVMRTYLEKPRTEIGWKGLIYDPHIDDSHDMNTGLVASRLTVCLITNKGVPAGMERLNALTPQYFNGLVAYDAIGARNTLDQKAREYGSGTSSPVGFKNTTDGSIKAAVEAVNTANHPHSFLGIDMDGMHNQVNTTGNSLAHIILRGGDLGHNYDYVNVIRAKTRLRTKGLLQAIVIDVSHGNSTNAKGDKVAALQMPAVEVVAAQVGNGETAIKGVMIESNLQPGKQKPDIREKLLPGVSITDECVGLEDTKTMLDQLAEAVRQRRQ